MQPTSWLRVLIVFGVGVFTAFQVGKVPPVLTAIQADLGMSLAAMAWVVSIFSTIAVLLGSLSGIFADLLGYRKLIASGLFCSAISSFIGSLSQTPEILLVTRFFEGVGGLCATVACPGLMVKITDPRDTKLALGIWSAFMPFGMAVMMVLSPLILKSLDWRGLWQANGFLLFGYGVLFVLTFKGPEKGSPAKKVSLGLVFKSIAEVAVKPGPILLAICFATYSLQWMSVFAFLPTILEGEKGLSPDWAAMLTALAVVVNVIGNVSGGWLIRKGFKPWQLICICSVVMGLCSLAIFSTSMGLTGRYIFCLVFSMVGGMLPASALVGAIALAPSPSLIATTNGFVMQGAQLGSLTGPPLLVMVVSQTGGWHGAPWLLTSSACLGLILGLVLGSVTRERGSASRV